MSVSVSRSIDITVGCLLLVVVVLSVVPCSGTLQSIEIDVCAEIYRVVDGDTFDAFPVGRVRLADIDAPELGTSEGEQARQALLSLVSRYGSRVYLDVDDLYVMDRYNRIIAIAYLRYNSTHVINVNKWLIDNGYATVSDYLNEFNPYTWTLYTHLSHDPCIEKIITTTVTTTRTITQTLIVERTATTTKTVTEKTTLRITETATKTMITTSTQTVTTPTTTTTTYTLITTETVFIEKPPVECSTATHQISTPSPGTVVTITIYTPTIVNRSTTVTQTVEKSTLTTEQILVTVTLLISALSIAGALTHILKKRR